MPPLPSDLRHDLDQAVVRARDTAEEGARAAIAVLGVEAAAAPAALGPSDRDLRTALRARGRSIGGGVAAARDRRPRRGDRLRAVAPDAVRPVPRRERPAPPPGRRRGVDGRGRRAGRRGRRAGPVGPRRPLCRGDAARHLPGRRPGPPGPLRRRAPDPARRRSSPPCRPSCSGPTTPSAGSTSSGRPSARRRSTSPVARSAAPTSRPSPSSSPSTTWSASCSRTRSAPGGRAATPRARS